MDLLQDFTPHNQSPLAFRLFHPPQKLHYAVMLRFPSPTDHRNTLTGTGQAGARGSAWARFQAIAFSVITACLGSALVVVNAAEQSGERSIANAARAQIGKTVRYDPSYRTLDYPNGDVPIQTGVCTDVVVRALRASLGLDLQKLVHEDMKRNFSLYPNNWGLKKPDRNIDHRRVPNLRTYFKRRGWELPITQDYHNYRAGDIVTCIVPPNLAHIMIVSDRTTAAGRPLIIHNIGAGVQEEDRLFEFKITGHYRIKESAPPARQLKLRTEAPEQRRVQI